MLCPWYAQGIGLTQEQKLSGENIASYSALETSSALYKDKVGVKCVVASDYAEPAIHLADITVVDLLLLCVLFPGRAVIPGCLKICCLPGIGRTRVAP